jgi:hypothetical protein
VLNAYKGQVAGLIDGGVHILMVETIFDSLNAKAALAGIDEYYEETGCPRLPIIISGTVVDMSGRTLSGQTTEAFYVSMRHAKPLCIGLNCALGSDNMVPFIQVENSPPLNQSLCVILSNFAQTALNAGARQRRRVFRARIPKRGASQRDGRLRRDATSLVTSGLTQQCPSAHGRVFVCVVPTRATPAPRISHSCYTPLRPESFAKSLKVFIETKIVNMLGGCCGTTPEHIKAVDTMLKMQAATIKVREPKPPFGEMRISGLEPLTVDKGLGFMNVGERCNIAGSIKFKKLILNGDYDKALAYC